jgi:hypothetical protein
MIDRKKCKEGFGKDSRVEGSPGKIPIVQQSGQIIEQHV